MKIEEQVLSREQMAHLKELGVDTSDASMYWSYENSCGDRYWTLLPYDKYYDVDEETVPTYTIGDIINKLPNQLYDEKSNPLKSLLTFSIRSPMVYVGIYLSGESRNNNS